MAILLIIRYVLAAENKRRDAEPVSDDMYYNGTTPSDVLQPPSKNGGTVSSSTFNDPCTREKKTIEEALLALINTTDVHPVVGRCSDGYAKWPHPGACTYRSASRFLSPPLGTVASYEMGQIVHTTRLPATSAPSSVVNAGTKERRGAQTGARAKRALRAGAGRRSTVTRRMWQKTQRGKVPKQSAKKELLRKQIDVVQEQDSASCRSSRGVREGVSVCGTDGGRDEVARPSLMPVAPSSSEEVGGGPGDTRGRRGGVANTAACWKKESDAFVVFKPLYLQSRLLFPSSLPPDRAPLPIDYAAPTTATPSQYIASIDRAEFPSAPQAA
ncbi:hypothetical protein FB451DRAFT_1183083 [Mycena latifolia]|nr:hypothetical protein FB451DRAFT_1183083 [Mycena latifolia]